MYSYVIEYLNENEYRKKEHAIKKYNMQAYKKLIFEIYPNLREGNFHGIIISSDTNENIYKYECELPTDEMFKKINGPLALHYTVYKKEKTILLTNLTPEDVLLEGHQKELSQYKGLMNSKNNSENDMFKINLLNMMKK